MWTILRSFHTKPITENTIGDIIIQFEIIHTSTMIWNNFKYNSRNTGISCLSPKGVDTLIVWQTDCSRVLIPLMPIEVVTLRIMSFFFYQRHSREVREEGGIKILQRNIKFQNQENRTNTRNDSLIMAFGDSLMTVKRGSWRVAHFCHFRQSASQQEILKLH